MKTLSVRLRFIVTGAIAIVAVVGCCYFPSIADPRISSYYVEIGSKQKGPLYIPWKSRDQFDTALNQVCAHGGTYCLKVKLDDNSNPIYRYHPDGSKGCTVCPPRNIRTVKVTKSKVADDIAAGESAANDPNAMNRIQSPNPGDIKTVLDALQK